MEIDFDPDKEAINVVRHGISLLRAVELFANVVAEVVDDRQNYGEERLIAIGLIDGRAFVCAYTLRGGVRRIISLRRANRKERHGLP